MIQKRRDPQPSHVELVVDAANQRDAVIIARSNLIRRGLMGFQMESCWCQDRRDNGGSFVVTFARKGRRRS